MHVIKTINSGKSIEQSLGVRHTIPVKIALSTQEGMHLVSWQEIVRCEANSNYTCVFLNDGSKLVVSKTLARVEAVLPLRQFVRIHQSHLVNFSKIRFAGNHELELEGNIKLPVARNRRKELLKRISEISISL